jgi:hypothetical protein
MDVPASTTGIRLNTTLDDANAKLTVNGISSGNTSGVILLSYGENVITMVVGASPYSDDTKTYTLTVNRALPGETSGGDATLTRLATTGGFSVDHPSATEYTTSLGYGYQVLASHQQLQIHLLPSPKWCSCCFWHHLDSDQSGCSSRVFNHGSDSGNSCRRRHH